MLSRLISRPLSEGDPAPDFTLPSHDGRQVTLSEELANGPVVLYFFPRAFTPVCTAEACSFRDNFSEFSEAGATVLGISADSIDRQKDFHGKNNLNHRLLSDPDGNVHRSFGVRAGGIAGFAMTDRITFVIDSDSVIRAVTRGILVADPHVEDALSTVKALAE